MSTVCWLLLVQQVADTVHNRVLLAANQTAEMFLQYFGKR
jgi:hypothetical protein